MVQRLSEEMSLEALQNSGCNKSACQQVAHTFGIAHQFCDPNSVEREALGIRDEMLVRSDGFLKGWSAAKVEQEVRTDHAIREQHWLSRLLEADSWPVLFVCGANHTNPFAMLLTNQGIEALVLSVDWTPNLR
jgi:hypothetical protein